MRDWPAILSDAKARGLSRAELARELVIWRGQVNNACRFHGVDLVRSPRRGGGRGSWTEAQRKARSVALSGRADARNEKMFAQAAPGLNVNDFARKYGFRDTTYLKFIAAKFGYVFAPLPRHAEKERSP